jgi:hypothetical protein
MEAPTLPPHNDDQNCSRCFYTYSDCWWSISRQLRVGKYCYRRKTCPSRVYCLCCYSRHHNGPPNLFVEVKVYVESKKHGRKSYLELWDSLNWYPDPQSAVLHRTFPRCSYYVRLDLSLCQIFPLEMESAIWF